MADSNEEIIKREIADNKALTFFEKFMKEQEEIRKQREKERKILLSGPLIQKDIAISKSGRIIVCDPCYVDHGVDEDNGLLAVVKNAAPGRWHAQTEYKEEQDWGVRVKVLAAWSDTLKALPQRHWKEVKMLGVDSGQMAIFSEDMFLNNINGSPFDFDNFYNETCTLTDKMGGAFTYKSELGVVSTSGFGDGCYPCKVHTNKKTGLVDAVKVVFF